MEIHSTPPPLLATTRLADKPSPTVEEGEEEKSGPLEVEPAEAQGLREEVRRLKQREQEVIAHENAHRAVGGSLVRGGGYDYEQGPDNRQYIAGGDVQIDVSSVPGDPEATMRKAEHIIATAMAPVEPSPQDLQVASQARAMYSQASVEARLERYRENENTAADEPGQLLDQVA